jgi:hypothetical protein
MYTFVGGFLLFGFCFGFVFFTLVVARGGSCGLSGWWLGSDVVCGGMRYNKRLILAQLCTTTHIGIIHVYRSHSYGFCQCEFVHNLVVQGAFPDTIIAPFVAPCKGPI